MGLTQPSEATVIFWTADLRVTASAKIVSVLIRASRRWSWQVPTRRWVAPRRVGTLRFNRAGAPKYRVHSDVALSEDNTVTLILYYVAFMIGGDLAAYLLGLLVEYEWGKQVSLLVFLALYFLFLWVSWVLAVWVTTPRGATSSAS
jgi:hypothetical protein